MSPWLIEALEGHDYLVDRVLNGTQDIDGVDIEKENIECHVANAKSQVKFHYNAFFKSDDDDDTQDDVQLLKMGSDIKNPLVYEHEKIDAIGMSNPTWGGNKTEDTLEEEQTEADPNQKMGQVKTLDECPENLKVQTQLFVLRFPQCLVSSLGQTCAALTIF